MSLPNTKWIEAISKLNELTQTGQLRWTVADAKPNVIKISGGLMDHNSTIEKTPIEAVFITDYQGKSFRITKYQTVSTGGGGLRVLYEQYRNRIEYRLDILDLSGVELFTFPETSGLADLYKSIQYQVTDVDGLLNSLMNEPSR